jgi:hypothetical protein
MTLKLSRSALLALLLACTAPALAFVAPTAQAAGGAMDPNGAP